MNKHWPHKRPKHADKVRNHSKRIKGVVVVNKIDKKGGKIVNKFWELLETSTIFQGGITMAFVLTTCYLWATGQEVPDHLWTGDVIVLGFFFGAKSQQIASQITKLRGR